MNTQERKSRGSDYKPLLYTTTVRNPERYKDLMRILLKYDGQMLDEKTVERVEKDLFRIGLYRPMKQSESIMEKWAGAEKGEVAFFALTDEETDYLYRNNPQNHKEAGFPKGWPSRFDTQYKLMKILGFVYYSPGEKIEFSEAGRLLAETVSIKVNDGVITREAVKPQNERIVFLNAFARHQRGNPFIRELNHNIPLVLLLEVITKLNADPEYNGAGIAYHELPLLLFWKDDNAETLYRRIKQLRADYGYNPSDEVIEEICTQEILGGFKKFKLKSIVDEYPDDFVRKMRLTGLISLRGAGRFIDINHNEEETIRYLLAHYREWYLPIFGEKEYFDYAGRLLPYFSGLMLAPAPKTRAGEFLPRLSELHEYAPDMVKAELYGLSKGLASKHPTLRFIPAPARLEFLTALAISQNFDSVIVSPNYPCDDEGLPLSTAGGDKGDIECREGRRGILVEVTMAGGRLQTMMEVWPIGRHLEAFSKDFEEGNAQGLFVAPSLYPDTLNQFAWLRDSKRQVIHPYKIADFLDMIEKFTTLFR